MTTSKEKNVLPAEETVVSEAGQESIIQDTEPCKLKNPADKILTIPNILSLLRLAMIPVIILCYLHDHPYRAFAVLVLSGATDIVDGLIARRFNMISNIGKALDPIADKLTQGSIIICLVSRYPDTLMVPLCVLLIRETMNSVTGAMVIKKTGNVLGAQWHGKATTVLIWIMLVLYILWPDMPIMVRSGISSAATLMMLISLVLYTVRNMNAVQGDVKK